ncbi:hypothetical protein RHMOL_Rhmol05G0165000 [Rhododendron molle]|uniref:Uncharacterized protein n=1 Tax=Rhododendron molle TaxID=49168 RepID=A0ACC0NRZ1_RHOML|nr:hypothetical protein RHMOL_Rhmol05G0165000 [Rhododendron molle]
MAKIGKLEKSIQETKQLGRGEIDMNKLCLFPNAKLPEKFKGVDFAKFDGTGDPKADLQGYVGSLTMRGIEKEAMAQLFHESLSGPALQWFLTLEPSKKRTGEDIGTTFVAQYDFNVDLKMTTRELESSKMGENESFADFVKRWRAKAAQLQNKPDLKEQIRIITKNLPNSFAPYMVLSQAAPNFETFYDSGLAVEEALRDGTLERKESGSKSKRVYSGNSNVLFGNANQAGTSSAKPVEVNQISEKPKSQNRVFTQLSTPRSALLKKLIEVEVLKPLPPPQTIPLNLNQSVYCDFHQMPGNTTDNCIRLHHEIQNLINNKVIDAPPPGVPEWGWDPAPDEYQLQAWNDPLDTFSLPAMFAEEYQLETLVGNWPEVAPPCLDFSHFNNFIIHDLHSSVGLTGSPGPEEEVASNEFNPMDYLIDEAESEPSVDFPKDVDVAMMNLWENEPGAKASSWANTKIVNIKVGSEEWTVNKAVMEAEQWKLEDLWDDLVIADLAANLQDTTIGSKRKALADLWNEESKYRQISHLTRSGRIYQLLNLQTGESSNPAAL